MSVIKFYFDESVQLAVSLQLGVQGLDVVSAHSLDLLGAMDAEHLQRASSMRRVLCTSDVDFLVLAQTETTHAGIVFGAQQRMNIGLWVRDVRALAARYSAEQIARKVLYLPLK